VGAQGFQGSQGTPTGTGAQGSQGGQGAQGANSTTQGSQGAAGSSLVGAQGAQGSQGGQGGQGSQGAQGATGPTGPSDRRLKKDIKKLDNSLSKILKLRGVYYNWNNYDYQTESKETQREIGFIAQEVQHVVPELVFKKDDEDSFYQVKYLDMIALCLEAIKEQSQILDESDLRLTKLETIAKEKGIFN
jgi:hypothetical protein